MNVDDVLLQGTIRKLLGEIFLCRPVGAAILAVQYAAVGQRVCSETCADQPLILFVKTSDEFLQLRLGGTSDSVQLGTTKASAVWISFQSVSAVICASDQ